MKATRRDVWVVRHGSGFVVKVTKNRFFKSRGATQDAAMRYGRSLARAYGCELIIQGRNGRIRIKDSHGRDPFPPKG